MHVDVPPQALTSALLAVVVALVSASGFACSTSLQHREAAGAPESTDGAGRLMRYLLSRPLWLLGIVAGAASFSLHALALRLGPLALVQPVMISGVVLAVPVRAALDRRRPSRPEVAAVATTAAGLALFVVASAPRASGSTPHDGRATLLTLGGLVLVLLTTGFARRLRPPGARGFLLGIAAGVLFGVTAGLVKLIVTNLDPAQPVRLITTWPLWALLCVGLCGTAVNQRAYQAAPLSMSMPVLNIVSPLVALLFGWAVFEEKIAHTPAAVAAMAVASACMLVGLVRIARLSERAGRAPDDRASGDEADGPASDAPSGIRS